MNEPKNTTWAVINLGGKDHLVTSGTRLRVNRLDQKEGESLEIKDVVAGLPVTLKVVSHLLGDKINGLKFKNKIRYIRHYGHRQQLTALEVVTVGGQKAPVAPKAEAKKPAKKAAPKASAK